MGNNKNTAKKIKINFCDFWEGLDKRNNYFTRLLSEFYDVEISDEPDYMFCSVFSRDFLNYRDAVRVFFTGECLIPDFNFYDYAIGFDHIDFGDRYLRFPLYFLYDNLICKALSRGGIDGNDNMDEKTGFCSFVYSNDLADGIRKRLFDSLSAYKKVDSGGKYLNNIGEPVKSKLDFEKKYRFSIACENYSYPGYTTEKLLQSFAAGGIPIYWGDPLVKETFNDEAFINVMDFNSLDDMLQYVKEIDSDEEKYREKREQPIFIKQDHEEEMTGKLICFLKNIFDQDKEEAFRRNMGCRGRIYEEMLTVKQDPGILCKLKNKFSYFLNRER